MAYFSVMGVEQVGVGNSECPFLPELGGTRKVGV